MKFSFEKFGYIDKGEITLGNLTIIAGDNNTGKTYLNYAVYSFLYSIITNRTLILKKELTEQLIENKKLEFDINDLLNTLPEIFNKLSDGFTNEIPTYFNVDKQYFQDAKINFSIKNNNSIINKEIDGTIKVSTYGNVRFQKDKESTLLKIFIEENSKEELHQFIIEDVLGKFLLKIILGDNIKNPFIITSERTGVSLFYKELDINKNILIEKIAKSQDLDINTLFTKGLSRYPVPIKHNIDVVRDIYNYNKSESFIFKGSKDIYAKILNKISKLINGSFVIKEDQIYFEPTKEKNRKKTQAIPLHLTSTASKSILLFYLYIKAIAKPNDILIIDEPELSLHPTNQIQMAKLLANLVNLGIDVIITTHSDYMIKEFSNLIMLSNDFKEKERILNDYEYETEDILKPEKVKAYFVANHQIKEAPVNSEGIDLELFDETIYNLNKKTDDIYYSLKG